MSPISLNSASSEGFSNPATPAHDTASAVKHRHSQVPSDPALHIGFDAVSDATVERLAHHKSEPGENLSPHTRALIPERSVLYPYSQDRDSQSPPQNRE